MREVRNLLIGFEIDDKMSQMAYYDRSSREAVSLPAKVGTNVYRFPTVLAKSRDREEWHYGLEAEYFASENTAVPVKHLLRRAENNQSAEINGERYEAWELLSIFFKESLKLFGLPDIVPATRALCVTTRHLNPNLASAIRKALRTIGFSDDQFLMEDNSESFYYYCYSQRPQIRARSMGLLEFEDDRVKLSFLDENRKKDPHIVRLNFQNELHLPKNDDDRDLVLAQFIKRECGARQISAIFITGNGFSQKWAKMSVHALAECGQHVFEGDNLFVKGACWAAAEKKEFHHMKRRVYEGSDLVRDGLTIDVIDKGALGVKPLLVPGRNWYENGASVDFILDGRREIVLTKTGPDGHSRENLKIELTGLPERPNRTTRIHLTVECLSEKTCHVRAEDLGFGEFFPATHKVWEMDIPLSEAPVEVPEEVTPDTEKADFEEEASPVAKPEEAETAGQKAEELKNKPLQTEKAAELKKPAEEADIRKEPVSVHKTKHFIVPEIPPEEDVKKDDAETGQEEKASATPISIIPEVPLMAAIERSNQHQESEKHGEYPEPAIRIETEKKQGNPVLAEESDTQGKTDSMSGTGPLPEKPESAAQKRKLTPEEKRREEDHRRLAEMSGTGGATPEERKSTLERLFNLQIPSIQPKGRSEDSDTVRRSGGARLKAALTGSEKDKSPESTRGAGRKKEQPKKRAPYSMRFGIDFDADIPEEEEIDTDIKGGDDQ